MSRMLSQRDVSRLLSDPSPEARVQTATKIADEFCGGTLGEKERAIAEDIFRSFVRDAEVRVREALAQHVKDADNLPRDIATALARDTDSVAEPILQYSKTLSDADLIEFVLTFGAAKQKAIARRDGLKAAVSDTLVETHDEDVVLTLVENKSANITEAALQRVIDAWGNNERFHSPLVERPQLPVSVAERLVSLVSEQLRDHLVAHHDLPPVLAADLALQSRERATVGLLSGGVEETKELVDHLAANRRLTATLLLRAICMGDMPFLEYGLARLAGVPLVNARLLIHDSGELGLKSLYTKAALPESLFSAFRVAVDVARETALESEEPGAVRHSRRTIERILTQFEEIGADNLEYLLTRLSALSPQTELAAS